MPLTYYTELGEQRFREERETPPEPWTYCVVTNIWTHTPTIHRLNVWVEQDAGTFCGRSFSSWTPCMPLKHAEKIGRRCRQCFPGNEEV